MTLREPENRRPAYLWQLVTTGELYQRVAGMLGASAVAMGAYGAHVAFPDLGADSNVELREVFDRANKYHLVHSAAMLAVPLCRWPRTAGSFFLSGILFFCGACYYLALTGSTTLNSVAPVGGVSFILGWLAMAL